MTSQRWIATVLTVFALLSASPARGDSFTYPNFSTTTGLTLTGVASQQGNVLRLTPDAQYQAGGAWYTQQQLVQNGFTTSFQFQLTHSGTVADGLWFMVQTSGLVGSLNLLGQPNTVWVEFDTFQNTNLGDPNGNHVAILSCGTGVSSTHIHDHNSPCALGLSSVLPITLADGGIHTAAIAYSPGLMVVSLDGTQVLSSAIDLSTLIALNNGHAWVGFSAFTGEFSENNDILNWQFKSSPAPVPEPATMVLFGTGSLGIGLLRKRLRRV